MNKAELIRAISDHSGTTRLMAERMLNAFTATVVSECSKGHEVKIVGFGSFFAPVVNKRAGRNPKTGAEVVIQEHRRPRFTAGTGFKAALKQEK
ncbi:HU family DNA-binding protein [Duodenibacillus massiliensis]|uniref:HU family DNA-binding protein n=1 Tax=Duodenibacillus massiliensis TaxID=1852381 RepID=UPI00307F3A3D